MFKYIFLPVLYFNRQILEAANSPSAPSLSPTIFEVYMQQEIASEALVRQQDYARMIALISNETTVREKAVLALRMAINAQETNSLWYFTNLTNQLLALKMSIVDDASQRESAYALFIDKFQQETNECLDQHHQLQEEIYAIGNLTQQWNDGLNTSFQHLVSASHYALNRLTQDIDFLSTDTKQRFPELREELNQNIRITNASLYAYIFTAWTSLKQDIESVSSALTEKIDRDVQTIKAIIDSVKPNSPNDTTTYLIPEASVTNIVTRQAAAINALDDPQIQEARRMFDLALSCKEVILICIAVFNALILVEGMSVIQSLHYTLKLTDKEKLDRLRRGTAGPLGTDFESFITCLETIIVESNFTKKERLDRLAKLAEIQQMKNDSLSLFSSLHSLHELRTALKETQELCALGLLRKVDLSRKAVAIPIYTSTIRWRRVNHIRTLIYTVLRPYAGNVERDENDALGRKERWSSRHKHRDNIVRYWADFKERLSMSQDGIKAPRIATSAALMLKMTVEFDEKTSPDFSRYFHKLHARLCLLSKVSDLIEDLYFHCEGKPFNDVETAIQSINTRYPYLKIDFLLKSIASSQTLLSHACELIENVYCLTIPRGYWDIRQFSSTLTEKERTHRKSMTNQLHEVFKQVFNYIQQTLPLFIAWMDAYEAIAACAEGPLDAHLKLVSRQINQTSEEIDEYEQKYQDIIHALSSEPGLPGLVDLIDISYHLGLKSDQFYLSQRASTRRVSPITQEGFTGDEQPAIQQLRGRFFNSAEPDSFSSKQGDQNNRCNL